MRGLVAFVGVAFWAGLALADPPPEEHVRGDVSALEGNTLEVRTQSGEVKKLTLSDQTRVVVASRASLASVGDNAFIGTTAVPRRDGSLRALEVHVFADSMRGAGEGHRPWDLRPGSTMTNATVSAVKAAGGPPSTMTNATVKKAAPMGGGLELALTYAGGEKAVYVPPGTPVVKLAPGDRSRLSPGAHVFAAVVRQPDGTPLVQRVVVGEGGVRPPM